MNLSTKAPPQAPPLLRWTGLVFISLAFAYLLHRCEIGPNAHGLETIRARG